MVRRSSLIFAATLAVFSTLEPVFCAAEPAADLAKHEVQKPRFMKKNVKRYYGNSTGNPGPGRFPAVANVGAGRNRFNAIDIPDVDEDGDTLSSSSSVPTSSPTSTTSTSTSIAKPADIVTPPPVVPEVPKVPKVGEINQAKNLVNEEEPSSTSSHTSSSTTKEPIIDAPIVDDTKEKAGEINPDDTENTSSTASSTSSVAENAQQEKTISPTKAESQPTPPPAVVIPPVSLGEGKGGKKAEVPGNEELPVKPSKSSTTVTASNTAQTPAPDDDSSTEPDEGNGDVESQPSSSRTVAGASTNPSDVVGGVVGGTEGKVKPIVDEVSPSKSKEGTLPSSPSDVVGGVVGGTKDGSKQVDNSPNASKSKGASLPSDVADTVVDVVDQSEGGSVSPDGSKTGASATKAPSNPQASEPAGGTTGKETDTDEDDTNVPIVGGDNNSKINLSIQSDGVLAPIVAGAKPSNSASKIVDIPSKVDDDTNNLPAQVPASITSGGKLIANPEASGKPGDNVKQVVDDQGNVVSDVVGSVTNPSVNAGGALSPSEPSEVELVGSKPSVPAGKDTVPPASVVLNNGQKAVNPSLLAATPGASQPASITLDNGSVVPNPALITPIPGKPGKAESPDLTGSTTLPNGQVVPIQSAPTIPADNNGTEGIIPVVPGQEDKDQASKSGVVLPLGGASVTLPNGEVVPASAVPSQVKPGQFFERPKANPGESVSAGTGAQVKGAGQPKGAQSLPTPLSQAPGSAAVQAGQTPVSPPSTGVPVPNSQPQPEVPASGSQPPPGPTAGPVATGPQKYHVDGNAPISQQPIGYDQNTVLKVDSSITFESSSAPATTGTETLPTGIPTGVPLVLYPPTGKAKQPSNTVLIQIGFLFPLNYDFVWTHDQSQRQIFTYLPLGVAYCLGVERVNVTMQTLRAWDTTQDLHYITTLALMWIPTKLVNDLDLAVRQPAGKFYNQPDPSIRTLLSMVNNAIPIRADNMDGSGTETDGSNSGPATSSDAAPVGGNIGSSSPVKASSVGIGVGVVCGAAAYGAAMFFVARRYKKRRQNHLRSPSMFSSPVMSHAGGDPAAGQALMSGAVGGERSVSPYYDRAESRGSARSGGSSGRQQISAPVMAENSLGWN